MTELLAKGGFYYELYNSQFAGPQKEAGGCVRRGCFRKISA